MEFKEVIVTPLVAKKMLENNDGNRTISQKAMLDYAREMKAGNWKQNTAEVIKISKTGRILDGQHRLEAVIKSGVTITFFIAYGVDDEVFDVLDTGKNRSVKNVFEIKKVNNANLVSAILKSYLAQKKGYTNINIKSQEMGLTNSYIYEVYQQNPEFWQKVSIFSHTMFIAFSKILPPATLGGFYALFYDIEPEHARDFIKQLCTGNDIVNSSISALRMKLINDKVSLKNIPPSHKNALIIKTWNAYRTNKYYKIIKFDNNIETFPKPL